VIEDVELEEPEENIPAAEQRDRNNPSELGKLHIPCRRSDQSEMK
jgi:hypothetical protein